MKFCVIRHPDVENVGTSPESAYEYHRAQGWYRVSEWRNEASDFHLADFADAFDDLDPQPAEPESPVEPATEPATAPEPAATSKKEKTA